MIYLFAAEETAAEIVKSVRESGKLLINILKQRMESRK